MLAHLHGHEVPHRNMIEAADLNDDQGRAEKREVILLDRLREAAQPCVGNPVDDEFRHRGRRGCITPDLPAGNRASDADAWPVRCLKRAALP